MKIPFYRTMMENVQWPGPYWKTSPMQHNWSFGVADQIYSGQLGPGAKTKEFAEALKEYVGAKYCVPTVSGTMALGLAARSLLIFDDTVAIPAYCVLSVPNAFRSTGFQVELVDIDKHTGCMDWKKAPRDVNAYCYVHHAGVVRNDVDNIVNAILDNEYDVSSVIEDAACAMLNLNGRKMRSDAMITSFSSVKPITTGQGGAVFSNLARVEISVSNLIDQGNANWRETGDTHSYGSNLRFNDILASFGLAQLNDIDEIRRSKSVGWNILKDKLESRIYGYDTDQIPLYYIVFANSLTSAVEYLHSKGIDARSQYQTINRYTAYSYLRKDYIDAEYPNADWWTDHAIYLPFSPNLAADEAEYMADVLEEMNLIEN